MDRLERILYVDDDEDIRTLTTMALELAGQYQVAAFASGEDVLRSTETLSPQLFLLDYMMPGMSGFELWQRLQEVPGLEDVPVIFITAKSEHAFTNGLIKAGALSVIVKPFEITQLCGKIEEAWSSQKTST